MLLSRRMQILVLTYKATESAISPCPRKIFFLPFRHPLYTPHWRLLGCSARHPSTQGHRPLKSQSCLAMQTWHCCCSTPHCLSVKVTVDLRGGYLWENVTKHYVGH